MNSVSRLARRLRLDSSFDDFVTLTDGRRLRVRWIRPTDAPLLRDGFSRLSPESRVMRFFRPIRELTDDALRYLTEVDGVNHVAMIATSPRDECASGRGRGFGVARFVRRENDAKSAELAITVTDDVQGRGLGRHLVSMLAMAARERGIETFEMSVLSTNARARRLLKKLGAQRAGGDWEIVEYKLPTSAVTNEALSA